MVIGWDLGFLERSLTNAEFHHVGVVGPGYHSTDEQNWYPLEDGHAESARRLPPSEVVVSHAVYLCY